MNIKKTIIGLMLSLLLGSGIAVAADGNELLADCQIAINAMDSGNSSSDLSAGIKIARCIGMAEGVRLTMQIYNEEDLPQDSILRACFPVNGINNGQAVRIITSSLKKNPASLHMEGPVLAVLAFLEAYPCK